MRHAALLLIAAALLAPLPALAASQNTARATGDLPVRAGPGAFYAVIDTLPDGSRVHLHRCTRSGEWCRIVNDHGPDGWVRASYLVGSPAKLEVTPHRFLFDDFLDPIP